MLPLLPSEIWLLVFYWATGPKTSGYYDLTYEPFQPASRDTLDETLRVKSAIVLVCRLWKALITDLLYEDVRVRHGLQALVKSIEGSGAEHQPDGQGIGRYVRRLELPYCYTTTATTDSALNALEVVRSCPRLQILSRPFPALHVQDSLQYEFQADSVALTSLRRLEWWHHNPAAASGGINLLQDVLRNTPNLQYLSVGGSVLPRFLAFPPLCLPSLTTLRLRKMNHLFLLQIRRLELPALRHVVVEVPGTYTHEALEGFWETFGNRIRTVEFGQSIAFCVSDHISGVLQACPHLQELNYYVHFAAPPQATVVHESLTCVRLHCHPNFILLQDSWTFIDRHLIFLAGSSLPTLQCVVLYGDWGVIVNDFRFPPLHAALLERGCIIQHATGTTLPRPSNGTSCTDIVGTTADMAGP